MRVHKISWLLYIVGSLMVFGSWGGIISTGWGWVGWLIGMTGWAIGSALPRQAAASRPVIQPLSAADEIAKLEALRKDGVITDIEFQREKTNIISRRGGYV